MPGGFYDGNISVPVMLPDGRAVEGFVKASESRIQIEFRDRALAAEWLNKAFYNQLAAIMVGTTTSQVRTTEETIVPDDEDNVYLSISFHNIPRSRAKALIARFAEEVSPVDFFIDSAIEKDGD